VGAPTQQGARAPKRTFKRNLFRLHRLAVGGFPVRVCSVLVYSVPAVSDDASTVLPWIVDVTSRDVVRASVLVDKRVVLTRSSFGVFAISILSQRLYTRD